MQKIKDEMTSSSSKFSTFNLQEQLTYLKRLFTAKNAAVLGVNHDLELLHAVGAVGEERWEKREELVSDGHGGFLERDFGVLDVCDAGRCAWDKLVSQFLQGRERPKKITRSEYNSNVAASEVCHLCIGDTP